MATSTPWGTSQYSQKIERGLAFHSTPGHGGLLVSEGYAHKHLSPSALKRGIKWGKYYGYEEDCDMMIVLFEIAKAREAFSKNGLEDREIFLSLSRWNPDYLLERGVQPDESAYAKWKTSQEDLQLRAARSPDLIIAAWGIDDTKVSVMTADDQKHLVTMESYQARSGLNLLSKCVKI